MASHESITTSDILACTALAFEWAESYDTKDFNHLSTIMTATVTVDYTGVKPDSTPQIVPPAALAYEMSRPTALGSPLMKTQHFLGAAKWSVPEPDTMEVGTIEATFQNRVAHQLYVDEGLKEVKERAHAYGVVTLRFVKSEGEWRIGFLKPTMRWCEGAMERLFEGVGARS